MAATHNQLLIELYAHLAAPLRDSVTEALRGDNKARYYASNQTLARAIRKGDAAAAERAATSHLAAALAAVVTDSRAVGSRAAGEQPR